MEIVLPALAVAFSAFCVWLGVRIINRREQWAKWTLLAVGLPVLYVAGSGPAYWLINHKITPLWFETACFWFYTPLYWLYVISPEPMGRALEWYGSLWR